MTEIGWVERLKNRKLSEFNTKPIIDVGTMKVLKDEDIPIDYITIKIGGKVFSTKFGNFNNGLAKLQLVKTENIGHENNLWFKGTFVEGAKHTPLSEPVPFELNIYTRVINCNEK